MNLNLRIGWALVFVLVCLFGIQLFKSFQWPITTYDALYYHLPFSVHFLKSHSLQTPQIYFGDPSQTFYPIFSELIEAALLAPLHGSDRLAKFGELPFLFLSVVAICALGHRIGLGAGGIAYTLVFTLATKRFLLQLPANLGNDIFLAFGELSFLYWMMLPLNKFRQRAFLCGLALGWCIGVKYLGAVKVPILLLVYSIYICSSVWCEVNCFWKIVKQLFFELFVCVFVAGLVGGYFYFRNAIFAGSPLAPVSLKIFDFTFWQGSDAAAMAAKMWANQNTSAFHPLLQPNQVGDFFLFLIVPACVLTFVMMLWHWKQHWRISLILVTAIFLWLMVVMNAPDRRDVRYFYSSLWLLPLSLGWLAERPKVRFIVVVAAIICVGWTCGPILKSLLRPWSFREYLWLPLMGMGLWLVTHPCYIRRMALAAVLGALFAMPIFESEYLQGRYIFWRTFFSGKFSRAWINSVIHFSQGDKVLLVGSNCSYPFLGFRLSNSVFQLPIDQLQTGNGVFEWGTAPPKNRGKELPQSLIIFQKNIERTGIDWIVVFGNHPELDWIKQYPERYRLLWRNAESRLFHVKRNSMVAR